MRLASWLTVPQVERIHREALRVLAEIGVGVEHPAVRERLAALGGQPHEREARVTFAPGVVEGLIGAAPKRPFSTGPARIEAVSGIYQSLYLDPEDNRLQPFDEACLARWAALARQWGGIERMWLLGVPFPLEGIPAACSPLSEKLMAWKHGFAPAGSVLETRFCAPLLEMAECHAAHAGKPAAEVFQAVGFLVSPLRLARPECEQLLFFAERGFTMRIGHLPTQGGSAPVTLAGALVLALAEQFFLFLLRRAFQPGAGFSLNAGVATLDMRQGCCCYGRPEQARVNAAFADLARWYGCACGGHTGLTAAKRPSPEAAAQKAAGALVTALAAGTASIEAGLLSNDEILSPVQLALDLELTLALRALLAEPAVDEASCAFEEIRAIGIGGNHLGTAYTAERFRDELFMPRLGASETLNRWLESGQAIDLDRARERVREAAGAPAGPPSIGADEERELRAIIQRAARDV